MDNAGTPQPDARTAENSPFQGIVLAVGLASLATNVLMPTLVGVYVDSFGLSIGQAGLTSAVYMAGGGVGAAMVSWLLLSMRTRVLLRIALAALAIGNALSVFAHSGPSILTVRFIAGLGEGAGYALMGAGISRMREPNRVYGIFDVALLLLATTVQYLVPWLRGTFGSGVLFWVIAAAPLILLPFTRRFPNLRLVSQSGNTPRRLDTRVAARGYFWAGVLATLVVYVAYGAGFTYIERIGVRAGLPADEVARILGWGYFAGVGGALLAIATAKARSRGLIIFLALVAVTLLTLLTLVPQTFTYRIGVMALYFVWFFFVPNLMSALSLADPSGRLAALGIGAQEWGISLGPAVGALWLTGDNFSPIGWISAVGYGLAMILLLPVLRRIQHDMKAAAMAAFAA
jgi:DHA1 family inner membrane transport protein